MNSNTVAQHGGLASVSAAQTGAKLLDTKASNFSSVPSDIHDIKEMMEQFFDQLSRDTLDTNATMALLSGFRLVQSASVQHLEEILDRLLNQSSVNQEFLGKYLEDKEQTIDMFAPGIQRFAGILERLLNQSSVNQEVLRTFLLEEKEQISDLFAAGIQRFDEILERLLNQSSVNREEGSEPTVHPSCAPSGRFSNTRISYDPLGCCWVQ